MNIVAEDLGSYIRDDFKFCYNHADNTNWQRCCSTTCANLIYQPNYEIFIAEDNTLVTKEEHMGKSCTEDAETKVINEAAKRFCTS